ncbi:MAG: regulatory iron-sulfur-containing complex subunit RicT [Bacteroidota bacterium]|nr:regulatory iron-sulfur-containing complex subunit RicT [Bacteroidota bacterium]
MGCKGCSTSCGSGLPRGCKNNGNCGSGGCQQLVVFDWLSNVQGSTSSEHFDGIEVRFKGSRKHFYKNSNRLPLAVGDVVAVEASPGHDIGVVSVVGEMAKLQMKKKLKSYETDALNVIYRKAKENDISKWQKATSLEEDSMYEARKIALNLGLEMKISDVEYQGDNTKATFYYTANGRVDFRELIKKLSSSFRVKIEMRQIGARQESARLGGIGACGRELCCSSWLTDFRTVSTSAARYQQLSINPQKLAGQCGKLKCCLNFELDSYVEGLKEFPDTQTVLKTKKGNGKFVKMDIFQRKVWYTYDDPNDYQTFELDLDYVKDIISKNKQGIIVDQLDTYVKAPVEMKNYFNNVVGQDSINRFDRKTNRSSRQRKNRSKFRKSRKR